MAEVKIHIFRNSFLYLFLLRILSSLCTRAVTRTREAKASSKTSSKEIAYKACVKNDASGILPTRVRRGHQDSGYPVLIVSKIFHVSILCSDDDDDDEEEESGGIEITRSRSPRSGLRRSVRTGKRGRWWFDYRRGSFGEIFIHRKNFKLLGVSGSCRRDVERVFI